MHKACTCHVRMQPLWVRVLDGGKESQGRQKAYHTCRQRPQCPDSSSNPFWVTWVVSSQGLKILAVYLQYYSRQNSKHRGRSKQQEGGGDKWEGI